MVPDNKVGHFEAEPTREEIQKKIFDVLMKKHEQGFIFEDAAQDPLNDILGFDDCDIEQLKAFLTWFVDVKFKNTDDNDEKDILYMCFGFFAGKYKDMIYVKDRRQYYLEKSDHIEMKGKKLDKSRWKGLTRDEKIPRAAQNLDGKSGEKSIIRRLSSKLAGDIIRGKLSLDMDALDGRYYDRKSGLAIPPKPSYIERMKKKQAANGDKSEVSEAQDTESSVKRYKNIPPENQYFSGRDEQLEQIRACFEQSKATPSIQAISGLGGVGKTQIALKYAHNNTDDYDVILWLSAESKITLEQSAGNFVAYMTPQEYRQLKQANNEQNIVTAFRDWFESHGNSVKWLIVFDNVEDIKVIKPYLPQKCGGHILITSQLSHDYLKNITDINIEEILSLEVFDKNTAVDFLLKRAKRDDAENAAIIAERLGYLPLALEQAAAYVFGLECEFSEYILLMEEYGLRVFENYEKSVRTTWEISIEKIQAENSRSSAKELLYLSPILRRTT